ncbi:hypothetical protein [Nissabacter sp. SGAir0207]|uniref:hypothetical protein n=1 Tax=Nissabacter sp. SGAir0207 TaxID=2126321 RepID=UPI0010F939F2|nr:hypothetical protein [Nissabacter sp. SGAir0207]
MPREFSILQKVTLSYLAEQHCNGSLRKGKHCQIHLSALYLQVRPRYLKKMHKKSLTLSNFRNSLCRLVKRGAVQIIHSEPDNPKAPPLCQLTKEGISIGTYLRFEETPLSPPKDVVFWTQD